jgi:AraC-like DNA-binding protein
MNITLESTDPPLGSSFRIMVNPRLNNLYFWHFHPTYELVLIDADTGNRHIGNHKGSFKGSDLAFIGCDIPHLNFDFGIKSHYEKVVVHIMPQFFNFINSDLPELYPMTKMLEESTHALIYGKATKDKVRPLLKKLHRLNHFEKLLSMMEILNIMANAEDKKKLHTYPVVNNHNKEQVRLNMIYKFIDENFDKSIRLGEIASHCNMTVPSFCRYFKKMTKLSFVDFINRYRVNYAKQILTSDVNIGEVSYKCGFENLSYFDKVFKRVEGITPKQYIKSLLVN